METFTAIIDSSVPPLIINGGLVVTLIYLFFTGKVLPVSTVDLLLKSKQEEIDHWKASSLAWEKVAKEALGQNSKLLVGNEASLHVVESLPRATPNPGGAAEVQTT